MTSSFVFPCLVGGVLLAVWAVRQYLRTANPFCRAPYGRRESFLSPAETDFYFSLSQQLEGQAVICPKPAVRELLYVTGKAGRHSGTYFNWISQKHVDFVLCDPDSMQPVCAVELDDASHQRRDRRRRDRFMDKAFGAAGLPLFHVPCQSSYPRRELLPILRCVSQCLGEPLVPPEDEPPRCPLCGSPMVRRTARQGPNAGQPFYGCTRFPQCRGTLPVRKG